SICWNATATMKPRAAIMPRKLSRDQDLSRERGADRSQSFPNAEIDRAVERRPGHDLHLSAGRDPELGEIAKLTRIPIADALHGHAITHRDLVERAERRVVECPFARWDRSAVRIRRGLADRRGHAIDQLVRCGMLELLGFVVHAIPRIAERSREIRLDDA